MGASPARDQAIAPTTCATPSLKFGYRGRAVLGVRVTGSGTGSSSARFISRACGSRSMSRVTPETITKIGVPMNEWLKPHIEESEAGMEVTSYLPAELDRA